MPFVANAGRVKNSAIKDSAKAANFFIDKYSVNKRYGNNFQANYAVLLYEFNCSFYALSVRALSSDMA